MNTHPALLPKFRGQGMYGMPVHRATGAPVHLVDEEYDTGRVVAQCERVQKHERALLADALTRVADGRLRLSD